MTLRWRSNLMYVAAGLVAVSTMGLSPSLQVWGPDVAWKPSAKAEAKLTGCVVYECLVDIMANEPTDTVRASQFSRAVRLALGDNVYATRFRELGQVDLVEATKLPRDEETTDYIVNGYPEIIPVDDRTQQLDFTKDPDFWRIRIKHPKAQIWAPAKFDHVERDKDQQMVIVFTAPIRDGCRACATVGTATFAHVYSRLGEFRGMRLRSTRPVG